jgi:hypothetical protein
MNWKRVIPETLRLGCLRGLRAPGPQAARGTHGETGVAEPRKNCAARGKSVIRQAISCDICGTEKKQTNHWFVAYDQGGELRVSGWNSRNRLRPGSKHLCGQTCLHKLVDDFMARALAARPPKAPDDEAEVDNQTSATDASLTSDAAFAAAGSPVRLPASPVPLTPQRLSPSTLAGPMVVPARLQAETPAPPTREDVPGYASPNWRAEAWERERERELRAAERRTDIAKRRRSSL